jgi:hypothetical protein
MRLIKLLFWVCATVILAYFLTDVRLQGKTIKQNVDDFIRSDTGIHLKAKVKEWIEGPVLEFLNSSPKKTPADAKVSTGAAPSQKTGEEISNEDRNKLKGIINDSKGEKK